MKPDTVGYIRDFVWDIRISEPFASEIKRQVVDIFKDITQPVFLCDSTGRGKIIVGSDELKIKTKGSDDHIIKTINGDVHIAGNSDKAVLYGVFSFLEEIGFYFLASDTICPQPEIPIIITNIDKSFSTKNKWRGMFISFCMVSTSIMSLSDYEVLLDNMQRMKMNRLIFYSFENEPIIDYSYKGERKLVGDISRPESGYFSYGRNWTGSYIVDEIKIGKEKFKGKRIAPMEFQNVSSSDEALNTGRTFMQAIIEMAQMRNIGVWVSFLPQFVSMNMSKHIKPMPRKNLHWSALVSCTDETVKKINKARVENIIESYPGLEGIFIGIPEGFYDDPYPESQSYIDSQFPEYKNALQLQEKYWGDHWPGKELQEQHIRADIGFAKVALDTIEGARESHPDLKLGLLTVCKAYLLTKLHRILPKDITFCDIESRSLWTHGGAPLFLFNEMMGRECSIIPRITDDGSQAGMQFNLKLYHMDGYCKSVSENGTTGMMMQTLHIKGADHNIKYLADGLWNPEIHPTNFYKEYIKQVYGVSSGTLFNAYDILEDNEILMGGRGAANMPWNHVPPEIAVMRSLQHADNPWHRCPLSEEYIQNAASRAEIYNKTINNLKQASGLFDKAAAEGACSDECHYMATRTLAYSYHLMTLVSIIDLYKKYFDMFNSIEKIDTEMLKAKAKEINCIALESAKLFRNCVSHVTDLAVLWMINSSMVTGTYVLANYMSNLNKFYNGEQYWNDPGWSKLFGECPYPAHNIDIKENDESIYEPG